MYVRWIFYEDRKFKYNIFISYYESDIAFDEFNHHVLDFFKNILNIKRINFKGLFMYRKNVIMIKFFI